MTSDARNIRFPPFRLDLRAQRLVRGTEAINIRPKMWELLRFLAERPGDLVTKDELMEAVWGDVTVTISSLNQAVLELRRILGDDARDPRFIETVHRKGFRFIAAVDHAAVHGSPGSDRRERRDPPAGFVGRESELERLDAVLDRARSGSRQVVFITGEPGIGKSSLLDVFLGGLDSNEVYVVGGRCIELLGEGEAYLPVLEAVDRLARDEQGEALRSSLRRFGPTWLAQLPWLLDDAATENPLPAGSPTRMLREFNITIEALSEDRPTVLWLEDLHWSDLSTIDLLGSLARRDVPGRLLVLATYRPVDAAISDHAIAPLRRTLVEEGLASDVTLELLDADVVEAWVNHRFDGIEEPRELARDLLDHTDGNPLFLETMSVTMVNRGWVRREDSGWRLTAPLEKIHDELPEGLRAIVETRLERLSGSETAVLDGASVVGETFAARAVAEALGLELGEVDPICERLAGPDGFLTTGDVIGWGDGSESQGYRFLHQVFRGILYKRLSPSNRQGLHRRLACGLESAGGSLVGGGAAEIAVHFGRGGEPLRAIDYLELAADGVRRRFAAREAASYLEHGLELLVSLPESEERDRRELELRLRLARALVHELGYKGAEQTKNADRALELGRRLGEARSELIILGYRATSCSAAGDLDGMRDLAEESRDLVGGIEDPVVASHHRMILSLETMLRGENERALIEVELCLGALDDVDPRKIAEVFPVDYVVVLHIVEGWVRWITGRPDEAIRWTDASRKRSTGIVAVPFGIAFVLTYSLVIAIFRRDLVAAEGLLSNLRDCIEEYGIVWPFACYSVAEGWVSIQNGDIDEGVEHLRRGLSIVETSGNAHASSLLHATMAEAELVRGRTKAGLVAVDEAIAHVEATGERFWEAEIHRLRGELLLLDGDNKEAEKSFRKSLGVSRRQGALSLELRGATSLARLLRDSDRRPQGKTLLTKVYDRFEEGFDTLDLIEAKELLEEL